MIDPALLALLRCPATGQKLRLVPKGEMAPSKDEEVEAYLLREDGAVAYPVRGGIPLLLVEEGVAGRGRPFGTG